MRFKEHIDGNHPNSAVSEHTAITGHKCTLANVKILVREDRDFRRKVKKAITIHRYKISVQQRQRLQDHPILLQLQTNLS